MKYWLEIKHCIYLVVLILLTYFGIYYGGKAYCEFITTFNFSDDYIYYYKATCFSYESSDFIKYVIINNINNELLKSILGIISFLASIIIAGIIFMFPLIKGIIFTYAVYFTISYLFLVSYNLFLITKNMDTISLFEEKPNKIIKHILYDIYKYDFFDDDYYSDFEDEDFDGYYTEEEAYEQAENANRKYPRDVERAMILFGIKDLDSLTAKDIKKIRNNIVKQLHPDIVEKTEQAQFEANERLKDINTSYTTLINYLS